jgi:hypothetical protein
MVQLLKKPAYGTVESQNTTLKAVYDKGDIIKEIFDKSNDAHSATAFCSICHSRQQLGSCGFPGDGTSRGQSDDVRKCIGGIYAEEISRPAIHGGHVLCRYFEGYFECSTIGFLTTTYPWHSCSNKVINRNSSLWTLSG